MSAINNIPKFRIKNKTEDENENVIINENKWRHIYDNENSYSGELNYEKQLPWMTFYKRANDLLQIRLVTTIGYVEKQETDENGNITIINDKYEAAFIKGFPLLLQRSDIDVIPSSNDWDNDWWENDWSF